MPCSRVPQSRTDPQSHVHTDAPFNQLPPPWWPTSPLPCHQKPLRPLDTQLPMGSSTAGSLRPKGPPGAQASQTDTLTSRTGCAMATCAHLSRAPAEAALENPLTSFPRVWASPAGAGPGLASSAGEGTEEEEPLRASSVPPSGRRGGTGPRGPGCPCCPCSAEALGSAGEPPPHQAVSPPSAERPTPPQQVRATIPVGSGKQACQRHLRSTPHFTDGETEAQRPKETNVT